MGVVDRDGVQIAYDVIAGPGDAVPLFLTHGYSASQAMWAPNLMALAADRAVVTIDLRGHGKSASPDEQRLYSHELSVADMAAVMDACGIERAAVGGLSLGGYLSLAFYAAHPQRVACLLLFDTGPGFRSDASRAKWNEWATRQATRIEERGAGALASTAEVSRTDVNPKGLANAARGMLAQQDGSVMASLPNVKVPTLVLVGADDERFLAAADYMAKTIPDAEKVVIPEAGHAANIDQPAAFNAAVVDFLRRHA
ncbi:MAG TPA: alpha/beta fold hydrolase [Mycobacteriales bacterium]|nr:alpha/beta fold hydrolase [Mycobacteriales bacterium]